MKKVFIFIKNYWVLIFVLLAIALSIFNRLFVTKKPQATSSTPVSKAVANYKSIVPGSTTQDKVNELLGFPVKTEGENGNLVAEYRSSNEYRNNVVMYKNGVASLIKEMVITSNDKDTSSITEQYGTAQYTLYDSDPTSVFNLHVYPSNGIAYLGADDGNLLEVWYFKPTTIEDFIKTWAEDYSVNKSTKSVSY